MQVPCEYYLSLSLSVLIYLCYLYLSLFATEEKSYTAFQFSTVQQLRLHA